MTTTELRKSRLSGFYGVSLLSWSQFFVLISRELQLTVQRVHDFLTTFSATNRKIGLYSVDGVRSLAAGRVLALWQQLLVYLLRELR